MVALYKMWIERCSTFHESAFIIVRIEDHETLKNNVHCVLNSYVILPPGLEAHRDKAVTMTSEIIRTFLHEYYAVTQDHESSTMLLDHSLNATTHFLPDISEATSELRNSVTKLRRNKPRHAQAP